MATIIIRLVLLAIFVAHFAMPDTISVVTLQAAPFSDPSLAGGFHPACRG
jgi:hypothetical protein